jgi:hypothetical protein
VNSLYFTGGSPEKAILKICIKFEEANRGVLFSNDTSRKKMTCHGNRFCVLAVGNESSEAERYIFMLVNIAETSHRKRKVCFFANLDSAGNTRSLKFVGDRMTKSPSAFLTKALPLVRVRSL